MALQVAPSKSLLNEGGFSTLCLEVSEATSDQFFHNTEAIG